MAVNVAINGFGRIGRIFFRYALENSNINVVAINDLTDPSTLAHLLKYDSVHGRFGGAVEAKEDAIRVDGRDIQILKEKDPASLPWRELGVDYVLESTGLFTAKDKAELHLKAGAKRVVISAPAKEPDVTVVLGVNEGAYDPSRHRIISNASCTTNCVAPVAKLLLDNFGLRRGLMTTIHAYTNDQRILDLPHKDLRRARAAALSMIPTTTGAARAVGLVLPQLKGKLDGMAIRVPTPNVSLVDLVAEVEKDVTADQVNEVFRKASEKSHKGIVAFCEEPLVSIDFNGDTHSAIVDAASTAVIEGRMVKVVAWYDNESGYSHRLVDLMDYMSRRE